MTTGATGLFQHRSSHSAIHFNPLHTLDIKEIKLVVDLMKRSDLTEFEIEEEGLKLRIKRRGADDLPVITTSPTAQVALPVAPAASPATPPPFNPHTHPAPAEDDKSINYIKSPIVGTFYRASSPDNPSFVEIGTAVSPDSVVCIIEAMKVMNEIQAETKGQIIEILVENGKPVEYGQPLFKVKLG